MLPSFGCEVRELLPTFSLHPHPKVTEGSGSHDHQRCQDPAAHAGRRPDPRLCPPQLLGIPQQSLPACRGPVHPNHEHPCVYPYSCASSAGPLTIGDPGPAVQGVRPCPPAELWKDDRKAKRKEPSANINPSQFANHIP